MKHCEKTVLSFHAGWRYLDYGYTNKTELNGPYVETGIKV
jgi:hypothetical protein